MVSVQVANNVMSQELDEEFVLVDMDSGSYFGARGVAAVIWREATAGSTEEQIVEAVSAQFDGDLSEIQSDVIEFLTHLENKGLLCRVTGKPE